MRADPELTVARWHWLTSTYRFDVDDSGQAHLRSAVGGLIDAVESLNAEDAFRPQFNAQMWRLAGSYLIRQVVQRSEVLLRQGDLAHSAFLVESGTLVVHRRLEGGDVAPIALLRPGSLVGEPALFGETVRMADVVALSPCVVWALSRVRLEELRASHPDLGYEILRAAGAVINKRIQVMSAGFEAKSR